MANPSSATSLQKVITTHVNTLLKSMDNILFTALSSSSAAHSHTTTAVQHISTSIETAQVIRAAEEIMVLTRMLRGLWCAGKLDVIESGKKDESTEGSESQGLAELARFIESWRKKVEAGLSNGVNVAPSDDITMRDTAEFGLEDAPVLHKREGVMMGEE